MKLKVLLPTQVLIDQEVTKITAEAENGFFTLLPRHVDFVAPLVAGLLSFETTQGTEEFLAVDEGILVKRGQEVLISTRNSVRGPDLGKLRQVIVEHFEQIDEHEKQVRSATAKLEAEMVQRFMELKER
ncbi:MAG: F0F1 ATP synthase subunit epsilon [Anaerolineales bacterium]